MEIIARRMERNKREAFWAFFEFGEINGRPLMLISESMLSKGLKEEGYKLEKILEE